MKTYTGKQIVNPFGIAPADALPVRSLLNSPDNALMAASICEVALDLIVGPMSGKTSTVLAAESSSTIFVKNSYNFL